MKELTIGDLRKLASKDLVVEVENGHLKRTYDARVYEILQQMRTAPTRRKKKNVNDS